MIAVDHRAVSAIRMANQTTRMRTAEIDTREASSEQGLQPPGCFQLLIVRSPVSISPRIVAASNAGGGAPLISAA